MCGEGEAVEPQSHKIQVLPFLALQTFLIVFEGLKQPPRAKKKLFECPKYLSSMHGVIREMLKNALCDHFGQKTAVSESFLMGQKKNAKLGVKKKSSIWAFSPS